MSSPNWTQCDWDQTFTCHDCDSDFDYWDELRIHLKAPDGRHAWCEPCNLEFYTGESLEDHLLNSLMHNMCPICRDEFADYQERDNHIRAHHWNCHLCQSAFPDGQSLAEHHDRAHFYCPVHARAFRNQNALQNHLRSSAHVSPDIFCPTGCGRRFVDYGAVTLHLESGACASGITRDQINHGVAQLDPQHLITNHTSHGSNRRPLITSGNSAHNNRFSPYSNASRSLAPPAVVQNLATNASYNPSNGQFECFFCHSFFRTLSGLNQHLASPRHQYATFRQLATNRLMYRCPNANCPREFLALSALVQHVERGSCGVRQVRGVMDTLGNVMGGMSSRRIGG
ncbi:hypothetical protein JCM11491_003397 [Sporobolomyces phaffii]